PPLNRRAAAAPGEHRLQPRRRAFARPRRPADARAKVLVAHLLRSTPSAWWGSCDDRAPTVTQALVAARGGHRHHAQPPAGAYGASDEAQSADGRVDRPYGVDDHLVLFLAAMA